MPKLQWRCVLYLTIFTFCNANAGIVISGTRIIYPSNQKSISIEIKNIGDKPSLAQVWLDDGDEKADPASLKLPFILTPPVSRVEPNTSQTIRIRHTGEILPQDRESLYYFNLRDIPTKVQHTSDNTIASVQANLQLALQSRLKFFYRPTKLPYPVHQAYDKVTWQLNGTTLTAHNPTPYHITYIGIELQNNKETVADIEKTDMIPPFSQMQFSLAKPVDADTVSWVIINDYGGYYNNKTALTNK